MTIEVWLKYSNTDKLRLPVVPEELELESAFDVNKVSVAQLGAVTTPGFRQLKSIALKSFFPRDYNASYCDFQNFDTPETYVNRIEKWRDLRKPLQLVITGTHINMAVLIDDFTTTITAGNVGDIYFNISFTEHKSPPSTLIVPNSPTTVGKNETRPDKVNTAAVTATTTYTVKSGDSLWKIATQHYSKGSEWRKIYNANVKVVGANPNLIYPGQKLVIPK